MENRTPKQDAAAMLRRAAKLIDRAEQRLQLDGPARSAENGYDKLMSEAMGNINAAVARL